MKEDMVQVAEPALSCASCDIGIGPDFYAQGACPVGGYKLCGTCYRGLIRNGSRLLQPYFPNYGLFLFPDGHTETLPLNEKKRKIDLTRRA